MTLKRTPLFSAHQRAGGKLIEFGGWEMPVQYSSIVDEHLVVRKSAGLFDIAHMGEVQVRGAGALAFLNGLLTNDLRKLAIGEGQYTLMCNEAGGVIDDLYAYRIAENESRTRQTPAVIGGSDPGIELVTFPGSEFLRHRVHRSLVVAH